MATPAPGSSTSPSSHLLIPLGDPALADVLARGHVGTAPQIARLVALDGDAARFELVEAATVARPSALRVWLGAIRAISLTATATPCIAVLLLGLAAGAPLRPLLALTALLGALLLQVGVNLMNDAEDHARLIDLPGGRGGAGIIQRGWLTAAQVRRGAWVTLGLGLLAGVPTLLAEPRAAALVGAIAALGAIGYSGRPLGLKYRALGDLAVLACCGPVLTIGFSLAAFGGGGASVVLVGVAFGLYAVGLLHTNNLQDIDDDRARGAVTVASLVGLRLGKAYLVACYVVGFAAWIAAGLVADLPAYALAVPVVSVLPLAAMLREILRSPDLREPALVMVRVRAAQMHLAFGVTACVGLGVALAVG